MVISMDEAGAAGSRTPSCRERYSKTCNCGEVSNGGAVELMTMSEQAPGLVLRQHVGSA
jgi:hypothetical protein